MLELFHHLNHCLPVFDLNSNLNFHRFPSFWYYSYKMRSTKNKEVRYSWFNANRMKTPPKGKLLTHHCGKLSSLSGVRQRISLKHQRNFSPKWVWIFTFLRRSSQHYNEIFFYLACSCSLYSTGYILCTWGADAAIKVNQLTKPSNVKIDVLLCIAVSIKRFGMTEEE